MIEEITNQEITVLHSIHNLTKSILEFKKALTEMRYLFFNQKDEMIGITSKPNKVTKK